MRRFKQAHPRLLDRRARQRCEMSSQHLQGFISRRNFIKFCHLGLPIYQHRTERLARYPLPTPNSRRTHVLRMQSSKSLSHNVVNHQSWCNGRSRKIKRCLRSNQTVHYWNQHGRRSNRSLRSRHHPRQPIPNRRMHDLRSTKSRQQKMGRTFRCKHPRRPNEKIYHQSRSHRSPTNMPNLTLQLRSYWNPNSLPQRLGTLYSRSRCPWRFQFERNDRS